MVHHLYPDLLENQESYRLAEVYWMDLVGRVQRQARQSGSWHSAIPKAYADGTPFHDGNPIFDSRSEQLGRALRIIQSGPRAPDLEIVAYLDKLGPDNLDELVIALALSREAAALAEKLISTWFNPAVTREQMQREIEVLLPAMDR